MEEPQLNHSAAPWTFADVIGHDTGSTALGKDD